MTRKCPWKTKVKMQLDASNSMCNCSLQKQMSPPWSQLNPASSQPNTKSEFTNPYKMGNIYLHDIEIFCWKIQEEKGFTVGVLQMAKPLMRFQITFYTNSLVFQTRSRVHVSLESSECSSRGITAVVVHSIPTCVTQDRDPWLAALHSAMTSQSPSHPSNFTFKRKAKPDLCLQRGRDQLKGVTINK